jgi:hypothetical protein
MAAIGIISTGTANKGVVKGGLDDELEAYGSDPEFWIVLAPDRKPSAGLTEAYTWLFDRKPYYELIVPKKARVSAFDPDLLGAAAETIKVEDDVDLAVIDRVAQSADENKIILVMWDEDDELLGERCVYALDHGCTVLDLSRGLEPIHIEGDADEPEPEPTPKPRAKKAATTPTEGELESEVAPPPAGAYTIEELEAKTVRALRSLATAHGWSGADLKKEELVERLLQSTDTPDPEVAKFLAEEDHRPVHSNGEVPAGMCVIVVHAPDGGIVVRQASYDKVNELMDTL